MFVNQKLQEHLETSSSISSQAMVVAEWNMNIADNISTIGNYRYRPTADIASSEGVYASVAGSFDINDENNAVKFYTGATYADVVVDGGLDNANDPVAFTTPNEKERLLYSLEDCFRRFRPRSGINKLRYFEDNYTHFVNQNLATRPRYYMASRNDPFKYWTSYRKESGVERGLANKILGDQYAIDDAAPFVVYKDNIPANRIVVKMQTNVGSVDLGPFYENGTSFEDPFYGEANKTTPTNWSIQVLKGDNWVDVAVFNPLSVRRNNSPVIGDDGYVELAYGIILPEQYLDTIHFVGSYPFASLLPSNPAINSAFFVRETQNEQGMVYVWNGSSYDSFVPQYGWYLADEDITERTAMVTEFVDPAYFNDGNEIKYKEFEYIRGIRVVVKTMNKIKSTFDLIELSPRLVANITDRTRAFDLNKSASDLGVSGMPVGQLLASNGTLEIFDFDDSFNQNNTSSVLSSFVSNNLQIKLFENISIIDNDAVETFSVPLKILYADGFPQTDSKGRSVKLGLRDLFFYFETLNAPQLLVEGASLSYAVSFLLDSIGFSNYVFRRVEGEDDPIIPYFFVKPETTIAQVLQELAVATQSAMFFDEFNNFVVMSKNYIMPSAEERATDTQILGSSDQTKDGVNENRTTGQSLSNIIELTSANQEVFNDGKILYEEKYIQKDYGSLRQANFVNQDKNWVYKPVLLWEVTGTPPIRSANESQDQSSSYALAAVPLNSDLLDEEPWVKKNQLINNIIDFGEGAYWVARYNGYFYANGEIIKYDAIEYSVSGIGNVWISSLREYQNYYSKVEYGGRLYPTGRVRIYSEPFYEEIDGIVVLKNGAVRKHGRAQFGTSIAYHSAGLPQYWSDTTDNAPVQGIEMDSRYLFSTFANKRLLGAYNQEAISIDVSAEIDEPNNIFGIAYADGKWVGVGDDGNFRISTNGEDWTIFIDDGVALIDEDIRLKAVAYGTGPESNSVWLAVGSKGTGDSKEALMLYSEDATEWTEITDHGIESTSLNDVQFNNNLWAVAGNEAAFATSTDTSSWSVKTLTLDVKVSSGANKKKISRTYRQTGISISKIYKKNKNEDSSEAVIVRKNHGLKNNEKIKFSTTGTLPAGLYTSAERANPYYVKIRNKDSFFVKNNIGDETGALIDSNGSGRHSYSREAATFTVNKHNFSNNNSIRVIESGTLPSVLSEDTAYYVRVIDKNNISLSTSKNGDLIDFVSAQSSSSHTIEEYVKNNINTIGYGNGTWAVAGKQGVFATSTDTNSWTARNIGFSGAKAYKIAYGQNTWVVVGASKKSVKSTNLTKWTRFDTKISKTLRTIGFGNGVWIAAGSNGTMSRSTNLSKWKTVKAKQRKANINDVAWNGSYWIAIGNKLNISKSQDGSSWNSRAQNNVGEIVFESIVPHNLVPFDRVILNSTGTISEETLTDVSISIANPANFTAENHKLANNDQVALRTTGSLPEAFDEDTTYYVIRIDKNTFRLASEPNGSAISTAGNSQSGDHSFYFPPVSLGEPYWVSPKNITSNTFTISSSRDNARLGITVKGKGAESGEHNVTLDTNLESRLVTSLGSETDKLKVTASSAIYEPGDRIYFAMMENLGGGQYLPLELNNPANLTRYAAFYVHSVVGDEGRSFLISESLGGDAIDSPGDVDLSEYLSGIQEENNLDFTPEFRIMLNRTEEILNSTLLSPNSVEFSVGNLLEISSTAGELVSPTRVSAIRSAAQIVKEVTISIGNPAIVTCNDHGLFDQDTISFTTNGTLPYGIETNINYFVERIDSNNFNLLTYSESDESFVYVETKSSDEENPDAEIDLDELDAAEAIEDDDEREAAFAAIYNYRAQNGKHSFVKSFNDSNQVVMNREVAEVVPQYIVTQEEVLIDEEDGETEIQTTYENVSAKNIITAIQELEVTSGEKAGFSDANKSLARAASRNGIIKNYFANSSFSETDVNKFLATQTGTVQSSALVFNGPVFDDLDKEPIDFISYAHKPLTDKYSHFGTRMRIVGKQSKEQYEQNILRAMDYFVTPSNREGQPKTVSGGSGGLGIMVNPENNNGYFFEIIALPKTNPDSYSATSDDPRFQQLEEEGLFNVVFYKVVRKVPNEAEAAVEDSSQAIPVKLWQGVTSIIADDGLFIGQSRTVNDKTPSVYDMSVEYEDIDENTRRFYLMINSIVIGIVDDTEPLPIYNNMALFVRGTTRAMFENIYAIANNFTQNTIFDIEAPVNSVFGTEKINVSQSFRKYAVSGAVQSTYLSGIGVNDVPKYNMYFEEFGTIMRECAHFNVKYDKAYPALYAKIADTFNKMKGYTVSGFVPSAYGAEFLVFNNTDTALNLDETTGNYLRIQGVSFTQNVARDLTVDDYFNSISDFSDPDIKEDGTIISPIRQQQRYLDIKNSRLTYGRKEFVIESAYIQSQDDANDLMAWMIDKTMRPRKSVGMILFSMPTIQLGDIVTIDYTSTDSIEQISLDDTRFVVYNIEYQRNDLGPVMTVYLSEVL